MNLLLIQPDDLITGNRARISGRRLRHLLDVKKVSIGSELDAGLLNGKTGVARILSMTGNELELELDLFADPPTPLPLTMVLALPRPKMLRRIFQTIATMGIKELHLINSWRVEKSYWQTPFLAEENIREQLVLGLEQAMDTMLPEVHIKKLFKPFVEDEIKQIVGQSKGLVAHPTADISCPVGYNQPLTLAIGPEGGFIDYEIDKLVEAGFQPVTLGRRVLRVETAIPAILGRLFT